MKDEPRRGEKRELRNCVIIGDIKRSRDLDNWEQIFSELKRALEETNERFSDVLVVRLAPTVGDEFQGAIKNPDRAIELLHFIRGKMPVDIYCGLGIGAVEKLLDAEVGMRGSAFYRARDALQLCKKQGKKVLIKSSDIACLTDDTLNMVLYFIEVLENSWTKRQREIAEYFRLHSHNTYEQLGKHFGLKKQSISDVLIAANWKVIADGNNLLQKLLKELS
ncbi:MAG: hypothetical protein AMJ92_02815 [candidate division Zixibacteria bacterium SM23_81]|nr:MAG: hypothetical protein AMJ92_02815 [candidate division Zixibacteria bacterium SM23_81]